MSRLIAVLFLTAGVVGGADMASADHLPRGAIAAEYAGYYGARYPGHDAYLEEEYGPYYDDRRPAYRRYDEGYYRPAPRYYDGYDPYYDDYYPERPPLSGEGEDSYPERARGFDPRRPHLGDGTDAPTEQYYPYRPRSCGEYYYWDGQACVDARKYPPYVGPKQ